MLHGLGWTAGAAEVCPTMFFPSTQPHSKNYAFETFQRIIANVWFLYRCSRVVAKIGYHGAYATNSSFILQALRDLKRRTRASYVSPKVFDHPLHHTADRMYFKAHTVGHAWSTNCPVGGVGKYTLCSGGSDIRGSCDQRFWSHFTRAPHYVDTTGSPSHFRSSKKRGTPKYQEKEGKPLSAILWCIFKLGNTVYRQLSKVGATVSIIGYTKLCFPSACIPILQRHNSTSHISLGWQYPEWLLQTFSPVP